MSLKKYLIVKSYKIKTVNLPKTFYTLLFLRGASVEERITIVFLT